MTRSAAVLAAAVALLVPATAQADNNLTIRDGAATYHSEDIGVAGNYVLSMAGNDVSFFEDKDPQGSQNFPYESCRAGRTSGGVIREVLCPKSVVKTIAVEPGAGEDSVKYTLNDIPGALAGSTGADKAEFGDAADDLAGEQGNDTLSAGGGDDIVNGDEGNDTLDGGVGNDKLTGGTGADSITAGAGDDTIVAADGVAETIDCGEGNDTVTADQQDTLTGCENVTTQNISAPTDEPTGDDKVRPRVDIGGSSSQRAGKSVRFVATCTEKGIVQAIGVVHAAGISDAMKGVSRKVGVGGGGVSIALKFAGRQVRNIRRDLRRGRKPRVRVSLSCVDAAGNTSRPKRVWIALRKR